CRRFSSDQNPTYTDVGSAGLVGNIARPTYTDVGSAGLVGNIARPTYTDVGSAGLVGNIARPTSSYALPLSDDSPVPEACCVWDSTDSRRCSYCCSPSCCAFVSARSRACPSTRFSY